MSEDEVGSVAEEAAKLLDALQGWAREAHGDRSDESGAESLADRLRQAGDHIGHGQDCRYCPVCQAIGFVRGTSPEAREKVVASAATLVASVADLLSDLFAAPAESPEEGEPT